MQKKRMHSDWPAAFVPEFVHEPHMILYILVLYRHKFVEVNIYTFLLLKIVEMLLLDTNAQTT